MGFRAASTALLALRELFSSKPEFVSHAEIEALTGLTWGTADYYNLISRAWRPLLPAGVHYINKKGEGYRLSTGAEDSLNSTDRETVHIHGFAKRGMKVLRYKVVGGNLTNSGQAKYLVRSWTLSETLRMNSKRGQEKMIKSASATGICDVALNPDLMARLSEQIFKPRK